MDQDSSSGNGPGALFDWDGVAVDSSMQHEKSRELLADENRLHLPADHFPRGRVVDTP